MSYHSSHYSIDNVTPKKVLLLVLLLHLDFLHSLSPFLLGRDRQVTERDTEHVCHCPEAREMHATAEESCRV